MNKLRSLTEIIGWAYDADYHCPRCAEIEFGAAGLESDMTQDSEGNPIQPIFLSQEFDYQPVCGDCHEPLDTDNIIRPAPVFNKTECQCETCQSYCTNCPGWFAPGEAEKAAAYLKMPLQEFFSKYLGVNWWVDDEDIFLLAPATTRMQPGNEYPSNPRGQCVFFEAGRCKIHPVKPKECACVSHASTREEASQVHEGIAMEWRAHQAQITELLGREPEASPFSWWDAFTE